MTACMYSEKREDCVKTYVACFDISEKCQNAKSNRHLNEWLDIALERQRIVQDSIDRGHKFVFVINLKTHNESPVN